MLIEEVKTTEFRVGVEKLRGRVLALEGEMKDFEVNLEIVLEDDYLRKAERSWLFTKSEPFPLKIENRLAWMRDESSGRFRLFYRRVAVSLVSEPDALPGFDGMLEEVPLADAPSEYLIGAKYMFESIKREVTNYDLS